METGQSLGQRAFMTGPGVFSSNDFQSYEATLAYLKRYKEHYRTPNIKSYMVGNRKQRQWVVQAAKELGLMPTTEGGRDMKMDMTHAIDGMHGNEHTLPVFPLYKDVVELFARTNGVYADAAGELRRHHRRGVFLHDDRGARRQEAEPLLSAQRPRRHDAPAPRLGAEGRVRVPDGGVGRAHPAPVWWSRRRTRPVAGARCHWEMWGFAMGGMTPREVLKAATIDGARIIGFAEDLGFLEVGKLADLVVLDRNPLTDIRNTNSVPLRDEERRALRR